MSPRTPKLLEDIRDSAAFIREITSGLTMARYADDRLLRQAVERNFEIIGEALRRLSKTDPETFSAIPDCRRIIAFRNILTHAYDGIDHAIVWQIITDDLPRLHESVGRLLDAGPDF